MKNLKQHMKILTTLSTAASDARKDTFSSTVIRTLYEIDGCTFEELSGYINEIFGFEPYQSELDENVKVLLSSNKIEKLGD